MKQYNSYYDNGNLRWKSFVNTDGDLVGPTKYFDKEKNIYFDWFQMKGLMEGEGISYLYTEDTPEQFNIQNAAMIVHINSIVNITSIDFKK